LSRLAAGQPHGTPLFSSSYSSANRAATSSAAALVAISSPIHCHGL
jgi:hypothetical protein